MKTKIYKIVRIVIACVSFLNMALAYFGKPAVETDAHTIYIVVSVLVCAAVFVYNTYKNFDVTEAGTLGTKITRALKAGALASTEVVSLIKESEANYNDRPTSDNPY